MGRFPPRSWERGGRLADWPEVGGGQDPRPWEHEGPDRVSLCKGTDKGPRPARTRGKKAAVSASSWTRCCGSSMDRGRGTGGRRPHWPRGCPVPGLATDQNWCVCVGGEGGGRVTSFTALYMKTKLRKVPWNNRGHAMRELNPVEWSILMSFLHVNNRYL